MKSITFEKKIDKALREFHKEGRIAKYIFINRKTGNMWMRWLYGIKRSFMGYSNINYYESPYGSIQVVCNKAVKNNMFILGDK